MTQKMPYDYNTDVININVRMLNIRLIEEAIKELPNSDWIHPARMLFIQTNREQTTRVVGNLWQVTLIMEFKDINWDMSMAIIEIGVRLRKTTNEILDENDIWSFAYYADSLIKKSIEDNKLVTKDGNPFKLPHFSYASPLFIGVAGSPVSIIPIERNMFGTLKQRD